MNGIPLWIVLLLIDEAYLAWCTFEFTRAQLLSGPLFFHLCPAHHLITCDLLRFVSISTKCSPSVGFCTFGRRIGRRTSCNRVVFACQCDGVGAGASSDGVHQAGQSINDSWSPMPNAHREHAIRPGLVFVAHEVMWCACDSLSNVSKATWPHSNYLMNEIATECVQLICMCKSSTHDSLVDWCFTIGGHIIKKNLLIICLNPLVA